MIRYLSQSRLLFGLVLGLSLLAPLAAVRAQTLSDGMRALDDKYKSHRNLLRDLFKGAIQADPGDKNHVEAIDTEARYVTYRVYLDHLEGQPTKIEKAFKDFESDIKDVTTGARNPQVMQPLADVFRDKVRIHALEVIQFDKAKPIHKLHNARILAKVADLGQGKLAETLLTVLQDDKQTGGVHYYVLHGLRGLLGLAQKQQSPPLLTKDEEAKCAEAIIAFLSRKPNLPAGAPQEEVDGFRILRREGVRALAQIRTPSFSDKVRPALTLARFAGADESIQPPPRVDERMEAALGLARMPSAQNKQYQPDYAAGMIARSLAAFITEAEGEKEKPTDRLRPWKIDASLLIEALKDLKADSPKSTYIGQVADRGTRLLQDIVKGAQLDAGQKTWFTTSQSDPPATELFKGAADTAVKSGKPAEPAEK
jgi:hypothetical protein